MRHNRVWTLSGNIKATVVTIAFLIAGLLLLVLLKGLFAQYYYHQADKVLRDPVNGEALPISIETLQAYTQAISFLEKAVYFAPGDSAYHWSLAMLYFKLGSWSEAMRTMNQNLLTGDFSDKTFYTLALEYLKRAVDLEPTNPDIHLAVGLLCRALQDWEKWDQQLSIAVSASPFNSALRERVAIEYLVGGADKKAMRQAAVLAQIDDSYLLPDNYKNKLLIERRSPQYELTLRKSYLLRAIEITWLASKGNKEAISNIAPHNRDAQQALQLFLESKNIE